MASSGSDRRALVFAVASLVVAGVVVAVTILVLTSSGESVDENAPFSIGETDAVESDLEQGGPYYIADPFGDDGFWVALENGEVVALVLDAPGRQGCAIRWVGRRDRFEDCDDEPLETTQLERYQLTVPATGNREGQILIDLQVVEPPPSPSG